MKTTILAAVLSLGSAVCALPSPRSPFAIGITIPGVPTHYLAKTKDGYGTPNITDAVYCKIDSWTRLNCDGVLIGASATADMVPLAAGRIRDGFSVDENNVLHWKNSKFAFQAEINANQGGEANWALYPKGNRYQLYAQLGCPNEPDEKHGFHSMMTVGEVKVVPK